MKGDYNIADAMNTPRTRFNGTISPHRVIDGVEFKLSEVKAMRALCEGATVNDIVLSIVGGGMRGYLDAKHELPDDTLSAMAPISVRDDKEKNTMGNQVSAMRVPLGTQIEDAGERVVYVTAETKKSKAMTNALGARQMTEMSKHSPALFMGLGARAYSQWGLANRMKPIFNTVVTNVPGPPVPIYSSGSKLVAIYGNLCLLDGVGLGHVVQSYVDQLTIGITACRAAVPDPEFYIECLQTSFEQHMAALKAQGSEAA